MKKRILIVLLAAVMAAGVITGCASSAEGSGKVLAAMADAGDGQKDDGTREDGADGTEEPEPEEAESLQEPSSGEPDEEGKEDTPGPDTEENAAASDAGSEPAASNTAAEADAGTASTTSSSASSESTTSSTVSTDSEESAGYTFEDLDEVTMYAKSTVNVRDLPSTDGTKIGSISGGAEVTVTGKCIETGWYRVLYTVEGEDFVAYASNSYIVAEKPTVSTSTSTSSTSSTATNTGGGAGTSATTETGTGTASTSGSTTQSTSSGTSQEFVNYLNQQRASAGLSQLTWDSSLATRAERRAKEISTNFAHDSATDVAENLYCGPDSSVSNWYTAWYNSNSGHRETMFDSMAVSAGCAYYEVDGYYYVVLLLNIEVKAPTMEELQEGIENGDYVVFDETPGVTVIATEGTEAVTDQDTIDAINAALREAGLIP